MTRRFGVSHGAVWRHAQAHLTAEMRAALATKLLQRQGDMRRITLEEDTGVVEATEGDPRAAAWAVPCRERYRRQQGGGSET